MAENEEIEVIQEEDFDIVQKINEAKKNTVPIEKYNKVVDQLSKVTTGLLDGDFEFDFNQTSKPEESREDKIKKLKDIRTRLFTRGQTRTNLEIAQDALDFRKGYIELYGEKNDPFLPKGKGVTVTDDDKRKVQNTVDGIQECIDRAAGNSDVFNQEFIRVTEDAAPLFNLN